MQYSSWYSSPSSIVLARYLNWLKCVSNFGDGPIKAVETVEVLLTTFKGAVLATWLVFSEVAEAYLSSSLQIYSDRDRAAFKWRCFVIWYWLGCVIFLCWAMIKSLQWSLNWYLMCVGVCCHCCVTIVINIITE